MRQYTTTTFLVLNFQGSLQNLAARRQGAILCQVNGGSRPKPSCLDRLKLFEHLKSSKIVPTLERYPMQKFLRLPAVRLIEVKNPAMVIISPRIVDLLIEWNCNHQLRYPADTALASVEHVPSVTYRLFRLPGETSSGKPKNFQVWEEL